MVVLINKLAHVELENLVQRNPKIWTQLTDRPTLIDQMYSSISVLWLDLRRIKSCVIQSPTRDRWSLKTLFKPEKPFTGA